jgi:DNA-binding XRE family transcriptional regulator
VNIFFSSNTLSGKSKTVLDPIDKYVIEKVKEKRIEKGYSQSQLAFELEVSNGFIGMVESTRYEQKYSLAQLNKIAKIFECGFMDFLPKQPL